LIFFPTRTSGFSLENGFCFFFSERIKSAPSSLKVEVFDLQNWLVFSFVRPVEGQMHPAWAYFLRHSNFPTLVPSFFPYRDGRFFLSTKKGPIFQKGHVRFWAGDFFFQRTARGRFLPGSLGPLFCSLLFGKQKTAHLFLVPFFPLFSK